MIVSIRFSRANYKGKIMKNFGNRIKALRLQRDMTQADLANTLNLTKSVVSAYETGIRMPSYDVLISITRIFNVTTDYLLGQDKTYTIDLSGLTEEEKQAVTKLIQAMKGEKA